MQNYCDYCKQKNIDILYEFTKTYPYTIEILNGGNLKSITFYLCSEHCLSKLKLKYKF